MFAVNQCVRESVGSVNTSGRKKLVKGMLSSLIGSMYVTNIKTAYKPAFRQHECQVGVTEDALFISAVIIGSISPVI